MRLAVIAAIVSAGCGRIGFDPVEDDPIDAGAPAPLADAPPGALWLVPTADSFCRSGMFAGTNYGTQSGLVVKASTTGPNYNRETFVKFSLAAVLTPVSAAHLVFGIGVDASGGAATIDVAGVADGWTETGVTWTTRPAAGAVIATERPGPGVPMVDLDITSAVQATLAGDRVLSLRVRSAIDVGDNGYVQFYSRESAHPPTLQLTCATGPCQ